jgi:hypothetical protein
MPQTNTIQAVHRKAIRPCRHSQNEPRPTAFHKPTAPDASPSNARFCIPTTKFGYSMEITLLAGTPRATVSRDFSSPPLRFTSKHNFLSCSSSSRARPRLTHVSRAESSFVFTNIQVAPPATLVFSQPSALPGVALTRLHRGCHGSRIKTRKSRVFSSLCALCHGKSLTCLCFQQLVGSFLQTPRGVLLSRVPVHQSPVTTHQSPLTSCNSPVTASALRYDGKAQ